jgi:hypothetical protein
MILASNQKSQTAIHKSGGERVFHFDSILMKAVDMALVNTLGTSATAAIKFYVDTSLICQNPLLFEQSLNKIFGSSEKGQGILEEKIKQYLVEILETQYSVNIPVEEWSTRQVGRSFSEFIKACKNVYNSKVPS